MNMQFAPQFLSPYGGGAAAAAAASGYGGAAAAAAAAGPFGAAAAAAAGGGFGVASGASSVIGSFAFPSFPPIPSFPPPVYAPPPAFAGYPPVPQQGGADISIINLLLGQLAQQSQFQSQYQTQNQGSDSSMMFLLMMMMMGGFNKDDDHVHDEPPPAAPVQVQQQPQVQVQPRPNVAIDTGMIGDIRGENASPLVLDINGDGVQTTDEVVDFDIDGDGQVDKVNNTAQGDGILSIRGGKDGKDLLGDNTDIDGDGVKDGYKDGFEALQALAEKAKAEGVINNDDVLDAQELDALNRTYGLGIKLNGLNGESVSLAQAGVKSINLSTGQKTLANNFDGRNNNLLQQQGALFTRNDDTQGEYADIFFGKK